MICMVLTDFYDTYIYGTYLSLWYLIIVMVPTDLYGTYWSYGTDLYGT